jgi:hypothetical protein
VRLVLPTKKLRRQHHPCDLSPPCNTSNAAALLTAMPLIQLLWLRQQQELLVPYLRAQVVLLIVAIASLSTNPLTIVEEKRS